MGGAPMENAKRALVMGIEMLGPDDMFNIVRFDHLQE